MKVHLACKVRVQMIDTNLPTKTPRSEMRKRVKTKKKKTNCRIIIVPPPALVLLYKLIKSTSEKSGGALP